MCVKSIPPTASPLHNVLFVDCRYFIDIEQNKVKWFGQGTQMRAHMKVLTYLQILTISLLLFFDKNRVEMDMIFDKQSIIQHWAFS